jgi:putative ABC transport system permease protein
MTFWDRMDVRYSLRSLRKDATFTLVVAFTLTMGIGGSTALFTVVHQVLLRPLAIPDSDRVLLVYNSYPKAGIEHVGTAASDYADRLEGVTAFDEQALLDFRNPSLDTGVAGGAAPERVHAMRTTASLFRLVRVRPQAGRTFTGEEDLARPMSSCWRPGWLSNCLAAATRSDARCGSMACRTPSWA